MMEIDCKVVRTYFIELDEHEAEVLSNVLSFFQADQDDKLPEGDELFRGSRRIIKQILTGLNPERSDSVGA
jgi:hypothetical protein